MNKEIVSISLSTDFADSENLERKNDEKEIHNRQENLNVGDDKNNKKIEIDGNKIEEKNNFKNENDNDSEKKELLSRLENLWIAKFEKNQCEYRTIIYFHFYFHFSFGASTKSQNPQKKEQVLEKIYNSLVFDFFVKTFTLVENFKINLYDVYF